MNPFGFTVVSGVFSFSSAPLYLSFNTLVPAGLVRLALHVIRAAYVKSRRSVNTRTGYASNVSLKPQQALGDGS